MEWQFEVHFILDWKRKKACIYETNHSNTIQQISTLFINYLYLSKIQIQNNCLIYSRFSLFLPFCIQTLQTVKKKNCVRGQHLVLAQQVTLYCTAVLYTAVVTWHTSQQTDLEPEMILPACRCYFWCMDRKYYIVVPMNGDGFK